MAKIEVKDERRHSFFITDNIVVDKWIPKIKPMGFLIYSIICRYAGRDQTAFPSLATIASRIGCTRQCVIGHIKTLEAEGLISVKRRKLKGKPQSNRYKVLEPPDPTEEAEQEPVVNPGLLNECTGNPTLTTIGQPTLTTILEEDLDDKDPPQPDVVVVEKDQDREDQIDAILAVWTAGRTVGKPKAIDRQTAERLIAEHGFDRALKIVGALAAVVARRWPDCRRLSAAMEEYGPEALGAVQAEERHEQAQELTRRRIEKDKAQDEVIEMERKIWDWLDDDGQETLIQQAREAGSPLPMSAARKQWIETVILACEAHDVAA